MTLTTHAIVGVAVARLFPRHPLIAVLAAIFSHFLLDAIPHWDYQLHSRYIDSKNFLNNDLRLGRGFFFDLIKIGVDFGLGLILSAIIFLPSNPGALIFTLITAFAGTLPDALQFAYFKIRRQPFIFTQQIHNALHSKNKKLLGRPFIGITLQLTLVLITLFLTGKAGVFGF
jgi:hypothetical protein